MTTCRDIIRSAMLEIRALASGEQPTADELHDCLKRLQGIMDGLFGMGVGATLTDQIVDGDTDLVADTRALVFASTPITLSFPDMPFNGARIQIKDMQGNFSSNPVTIPAVPSDITLATDNGDWTFVYIDSAATWVLVSPLTADSSIPLGDDEFFTLELAKRIAPMFGAALTQESQVSLQRASNRIKARFRTQVIIPCDDGVRFLSQQSYNTGFLGN